MISCLVVAILIALLVGCSNGPVVGTWKLQIPDDVKKQMEKEGVKDSTDATIDFEGDGTFRMESTGGGKSSNGQGNWELSGNDLTLKFDTFNGEDASQRGTVDQTAKLSADKRSFVIGSATFTKR